MISTLASLSFIIFSSYVNTFCYWIDGTEVGGYSPCYALNSVGVSMCCNAPDGFDCLSSGICRSTPYGPLGAYDNGSSYWRAGCSDNTWQDGACLAMAPWITNEIAQLGLCADVSFCPRDQSGPNTTCCNDNQGQQATLLGATIAASAVSSIQAALTATSSTVTVGSSASISSKAVGFTLTITSPTTSITLSTSSSASSTVVESVAPSVSTSAPNPSALNSSNKVWIAGVVVGSVCAISLAVVAIFYIQRRSRRMSPNENRVASEKPELHAESGKPKELDAVGIIELPASESRSVGRLVEKQEDDLGVFV